MIKVEIQSSYVGENGTNISLLNMMLAVDFFIDYLCQNKKLSSILNFLRVFIISELLIFFPPFCSSTVAGSGIDIYQMRATYHRKRQQIKKAFLLVK